MKKCASLLILLFFSAHANSNVYTTFNDRIWQQAATADYRFFLIKVTRAQLYIDPEIQPVNHILNPTYPKWLKIKYHLAVNAQKLSELTLEALADNYDASALANHQLDIDKFISWYRDVEGGDEYSLVWQPERGLQLNFNDQPVGTIENAQSAQVILSVWLGKAAVSESQRDDILNQWKRFSTAQLRNKPGDKDT